MLILLLLCLYGASEYEDFELIAESVLDSYISKFDIEKDYLDDFDVPYRNFQKPKKKKLLKRFSSTTDIFRTPSVYLKRLCIPEDQEVGHNMKRVISIGTEIYRIKYFNYLMSKLDADLDLYKHEYVVFGYSTASIYYFRMDYALAIKVLQEGIQFINDNFKPNEMLVWSLHYHTLMIDILKNTNDETGAITEHESAISSIEKTLNEGNEFPYEYILMYRTYFWDKTLSQERKNQLETVAKNKLPVYDSEINKSQMFSIHFELVSASIETDKLDAFQLLMKAILSPVNCTEDRLLNLKANEMAKNMVKDCINEKGWINDSDDTFCKNLNSMRTQNPELEEKRKAMFLDSMLSKYTQEFMYVNIIVKLEANLTSDEKINEDLLHTIFTGAIEMNSELQQPKIEILKAAIEMLHKYATRDKEAEHPNRNNTFIVYKWLAEFYAILCTGWFNSGDAENQRYDDAVIEALQNANHFLGERYISEYYFAKTDTHLRYLMTKKKCKAKQYTTAWKMHSVDGWIFLRNDLLTDEEAQKCLLMYHKFLSIKHKYIHQVDVLINYYRIRMYIEKEFKNAITPGYLKRAMSISVFNSEDRYRNKEAHELFSMHLLKFNLTQGNRFITEDLKNFRFN